MIATFLPSEDGKIAVVLIPDLCCHCGTPFSVVGGAAGGAGGIYGVQISPVLRGSLSFKPKSIPTENAVAARWSPQRARGHYWSMDSRGCRERFSITTLHPLNRIAQSHMGKG